MAKDKPEYGKVYALTGGKNDKCISNGNLIAAAPDLLAACEAWVNAVELGLVQESEGVLEAVKNTKMIIAKAKGSL